MLRELLSTRKLVHALLSRYYGGYARPRPEHHYGSLVVGFVIYPAQDY